jgi:hypothetical protein
MALERAGPFIAILLASLVLAPAFLYAPVSGQSGIKVTIHPAAFEGVATVNRTTSGTVNFTAQISVEDPNGLTVLVDLTVKGILYGWKSEVVPTQLIFTATGSQNVTVYVSVPAGTPTSSMELVKLDAKASWSTGSSVVSFQWGARAKQYYDVDLISKKTGSGPNYRSYSIVLRNTGNGADDYNALVQNEGILQTKDIEIEPSYYSPGRALNVNQSSRTWTMKVTYKGSDRAVTENIIIRVTSKGAALNGQHPHWDFTIRFSYQKEEMSNIFLVGIVAFVIIMVVVLALLLKAPRKGKGPKP